MANPIAGWYPDPSGDQTKLRWWDGNQWTDNYADAVAPQQQPAQPQTAAQSQATAQSQAAAQPQQPAQPQAAPQTQQVNQGFSQPQSQFQPQPQPQPQPQGYGQAQGCGQVPQQPGQGYPQAQSASTDDTLRLIAFILAVISTVSVCWAIIPLAWMIPMTVHCWGIYKRTKPNTTAFGVCTLIFLNLIGGILLLVSTRER